MSKKSPGTDADGTSGAGRPPAPTETVDDMTVLGRNRETKRTPIQEDLTDRKLGEFQILRLLGRGGMAEVYLAEQTSLKRKVALKLLRDEWVENKTYLARFEREAKAAAGLNHTNIVQVYSFGNEEGKHFIVQEYVDGGTLKNLINKRGPLDATLALHVMRQVASAMQTAGEAGIIHRDIKPENIMVTRKGEVKVADFGLARLTLDTENLSVTQDGMTMGTPLYMSPEQVSGKELDVRSDIYSFGITCYHMLAGHPPFRGETAVSVAVKHLQDTAEPLARKCPDLPPPLCEIVDRMICKVPDERYQSAGDILTDVRRLAKALKTADEVDGDVDVTAMFGTTTSGALPISKSRWLATMIGCCLLAGCLSAGIGWLMRPGDPRTLEAAGVRAAPKAASAREQYVQAMFQGDDEAAWLAVIEHWKNATDWRARATEQLALLYLNDEYRWDDARRMFKELNLLGASERRYRDVAAAGNMILAAFEGRSQNSQSLYKSNNLGDRETLSSLGRHWEQLIEDARELNRRKLGGARSPRGDGPAT